MLRVPLVLGVRDRPDGGRVAEPGGTKKEAVRAMVQKIGRSENDDGRLANLARRAARRAHAPYSRFAVGCVLRDEDGALYFGANIENAAYPLGICAERVALLSWRQAGGAPLDRVAVFTDTPVPTPPCGLCREALSRWAPHAEVLLFCSGNGEKPAGIDPLLPARTKEGE